MPSPQSSVGRGCSEVARRAGGSLPARQNDPGGEWAPKGASPVIQANAASTLAWAGLLVLVLLVCFRT